MFAFITDYADAKHVEEVVVSYDEIIFPVKNQMRYNYTYKDLSFINGYTRTEKITDITTTRDLLMGGLIYRHTFTYKTY